MHVGREGLPPVVQTNRWATETWRNRCRWPGLMDLFSFVLFFLNVVDGWVCVCGGNAVLWGTFWWENLRSLPAQYSTDSIVCESVARLKACHI